MNTAEILIASRARALSLIEAGDAVVVVACQSPSDRGKVIVGLRVDPKHLNFIGVVDAMNEVLDTARIALSAGQRDG